MSDIKCQTIAGLIEELAPKKLAMSWDNVGLLVGDGSRSVKKVMVCLDCADWVIDEAIENKVDMLVCHHPIIFGSIKRITADTVLGRKLLKLITHHIAVYCAHTNYDVAGQGLNDLFARHAGFESMSLMEPTYQEKLYKMLVYIPKGHEEKIFKALTAAGAGHIGNYSSCTFRTEGIGTFVPEAGTHPFMGEAGKLEEVHEVKLGTILPQSLLNKAIKAVIKAHPYEEPAYDIMPLENQGEAFGLGKLGVLQNAIPFGVYAQNIKAALGLEKVLIAGNANQLVKKVAMLNGSGSKFVSTARFAGADVLITGDMQYHELLDAVEAGMCVIDAGHFGTERMMMPAIASYLRGGCQRLGYEVEIMESQSNVDISRIL
jgi:dinuclear metal center YbgI/SA1388 family protein